MEVVRVEQFGLALGEPFLPRCALTLRAVPVSTGVVEKLFVIAAIAGGLVATESGGLAQGEILQDAALLRQRGRLA